MRRALFLLAGLLLVSALAPAPTLGQAPSEVPGAGSPGDLRFLVPVNVELYLDIFATDDPLIPLVGAGGAAELPLTDRWAFRGDAQLIVLTSESRGSGVDVGDTGVLLMPAAVFFLGGGSGDRPHLRLGPALWVGEPDGFAPVLGAGFPAGERIRVELQTMIFLTQAGIAVKLP